MSIFSKIALPRVKRSVFNLSHEVKFTSQFGMLLPLYWNYFEPNCTFKANAEILVRAAPMLAPLMHKVNIYTAWFSVPIRLLMDKQDFEDFFTGGEDGTADNLENSTIWPKYYITGTQMDTLGFSFNPIATHLSDMLGVPNPDLGQQMEEYGEYYFDAMPFRAFAEIYNNYYRDQTLCNEIVYHKHTGLQAISSVDLPLFMDRSKCYEKDYFTSALPWPQRGVDVKIPLNTEITVGFDKTGQTNVFRADSTTIGGQGPLEAHRGMGGNADGILDIDGEKVNIDNTDNLDIKASNDNTINDLRTALSLQRWFERNARAGARYIENVLSHFGQRSSDARLQRPEYLGGSRVPLSIGEVLQTSESSSTSAQATPAGRGIGYDSGKFVKYHTEEHCIIMCLCYVVPKSGYMQGLPAKMDIRNRFDFVWPEFAHLGEQEIRNKELFYDSNFAQGHTNKNDQTFGYQARYAQYKYEPNRVHGAFRSNLDFWHLARKFNSLPVLGQNFVEVAPALSDLNRIFAVETDPDSLYYNNDDKLWCQANVNIKVKRPLPYYSIPR